MGWILAPPASTFITTFFKPVKYPAPGFLFGNSGLDTASVRGGAGLLTWNWFSDASALRVTSSALAEPVLDGVSVLPVDNKLICCPPTTILGEDVVTGDFNGTCDTSMVLLEWLCGIWVPGVPISRFLFVFPTEICDGIILIKEDETGWFATAGPSTVFLWSCWTAVAVKVGISGFLLPVSKSGNSSVCMLEDNDWLDVPYTGVVFSGCFCATYIAEVGTFTFGTVFFSDRNGWPGTTVVNTVLAHCVCGICTVEVITPGSCVLLTERVFAAVLGPSITDWLVVVGVNKVLPCTICCIWAIGDGATDFWVLFNKRIFCPEETVWLDVTHASAGFSGYFCARWTVDTGASGFGMLFSKRTPGTVLISDKTGWVDDTVRWGFDVTNAGLWAALITSTFGGEFTFGMFDTVDVALTLLLPVFKFLTGSFVILRCMTSLLSRLFISWLLLIIQILEGALVFVWVLNRDRLQIILSLDGCLICPRDSMIAFCWLGFNWKMAGLGKIFTKPGLAAPSCDDGWSIPVFFSALLCTSTLFSLSWLWLLAAEIFVAGAVCVNEVIVWITFGEFSAWLGSEATWHVDSWVALPFTLLPLNNIISDKVGLSAFGKAVSSPCVCTPHDTLEVFTELGSCDNTVLVMVTLGVSSLVWGFALFAALVVALPVSSLGFKAGLSNQGGKTFFFGRPLTDGSTVVVFLLSAPGLTFASSCSWLVLSSETSTFSALGSTLILSWLKMASTFRSSTSTDDFPNINMFLFSFNSLFCWSNCSFVLLKSVFPCTSSSRVLIALLSIACLLKYIKLLSESMRSVNTSIFMSWNKSPRWWRRLLSVALLVALTTSGSRPWFFNEPGEGNSRESSGWIIFIICPSCILAHCKKISISFEYACIEVSIVPSFVSAGW